MSDFHFDTTMAWRAECDEVFHIVSHVDNQVLASRVDMMDIEGATARAALDTAKATNPVTGDHLFANLLPSATVFQPAPAFVIRMIWTKRRVLRTLMRAEPATAFHLTGKSAVFLTAMFTYLLRSGHKSSVAAFPRAMTNLGVTVAKRNAAHPARHCPRCLSPMFAATFRGAKRLLNVAFDLMTRTLESLVAIRADERWSIFHRFGMTRFAAENCGRVIRLKFV